MQVLRSRRAVSRWGMCFLFVCGRIIICSNLAARLWGFAHKITPQLAGQEAARPLFNRARSAQRQAFVLKHCGWHKSSFISLSAHAHNLQHIALFAFINN